MHLQIFKFLKLTDTIKSLTVLNRNIMVWYYSWKIKNNDHTAITNVIEI